MNIKEFIDAERWYRGVDINDEYSIIVHNIALNRIQAAVDEREKDHERVLEAALKANLAAMDLMAASLKIANERIAELKKARGDA